MDFNHNSFKSQFAFDLTSFGEITGLGELPRFGELTRFGKLTRFGEITSFSELTDNFTQLYPKSGSHLDHFQFKSHNYHNISSHFKAHLAPISLAISLGGSNKSLMLWSVGQIMCIFLPNYMIFGFSLISFSLF